MESIEQKFYDFEIIMNRTKILWNLHFHAQVLRLENFVQMLISFMPHTHKSKNSKLELLKK